MDKETFNLTENHIKDIEKTFNEIVRNIEDVDQQEIVQSTPELLDQHLNQDDCPAQIKESLRIGKTFLNKYYPFDLKNPTHRVALASLEYLRDPWDVIPDEIPQYGLADDAYAFEFAKEKIERLNEVQKNLEENSDKTDQVEEVDQATESKEDKKTNENNSPLKLVDPPQSSEDQDVDKTQVNEGKKEESQSNKTSKEKPERPENTQTLREESGDLRPKIVEYIIEKVGPEAGIHFAERAEKMSIMDNFERECLRSISEKSQRREKLTLKQKSNYIILLLNLIDSGYLESKCNNKPCKYCSSLTQLQDFIKNESKSSEFTKSTKVQTIEHLQIFKTGLEKLSQPARKINDLSKDRDFRSKKWRKSLVKQAKKMKKAITDLRKQIREMDELAFKETEWSTILDSYSDSMDLLIKSSKQKDISKYESAAEQFNKADSQLKRIARQLNDKSKN